MSRSPSFLAFDLGASSSRAVLGTLHDEAMRMDELHRFPTPSVEQEGHLFWDLETLWSEMAEGLRRAEAVAEDLRSLSVDSWGVDYVPVNREGRPMRLPFCYRDKRTRGVMAQAFQTLSEEAIYEQTGIQFLPFNTLYQVIADGKPEGSSPASHLSIADYFNTRFGGRPAMEISMASTTQMMRAGIGEWSREVMEPFGIDAVEWPEIVPSGSMLGTVKGNENVSVVATCSHDTGCAVAAVPAEAGNWAYISSGTWSLLGVERETPLLTDAAREVGFTNEVGISGTIRFLKNLTGLWVLQECARGWEGAPGWAALTEEAAEAPSPGFTVDLEQSMFRKRGPMEKRLAEACRSAGYDPPASRTQLVRLVLESIAESYKAALGDLERVTGGAVETVHLVGGGSRNFLLAQLTADACRRPVLAGPAEATALGNLLLQARALDLLPSGESIRSVARRSTNLTRFTPS